MRIIATLAALVVATPLLAGTYDSDNYGYNYSGSSQYDIAAQNAELTEDLAECTEVKANMNNVLYQFIRTNESLSQQIAADHQRIIELQAANAELRELINSINANATTTRDDLLAYINGNAPILNVQTAVETLDTIIENTGE